MKITILGSTGSIGRQALDVCRRLQLWPQCLSAHHDLDTLIPQIMEFSPDTVCVSSEDHALELSKRLAQQVPVLPRILFGEDGLQELASQRVDRVLVAISGFAALKPVYAAIVAGNDLALANKESLVVAGELLLPLAEENGVGVYPIDSEHSAIWQCLAAAPKNSCRKIYLTASGGPFRSVPLSKMQKITPQEALQHPVWSMGAKISIDSATMFNKGLELIEAMHLFSLPEDRIDVLIHPEGIVHSLVEFHDGALLAQMGRPDMRIPIQLALTWPERMDSALPRFDFFEATRSRTLQFDAPDLTRFPALEIARNAARMGKEMPLVMNAANEVAVDFFLQGKCSFLGISQVVEEVMNHFMSQLRLTDFSLDGMIKHDSIVRAWTVDWLSHIDHKYE